MEEEKTALTSQWPDDEELNTEGVDVVDDSAGWDELTTTRRAAGPITPSASPNSRRSSSNGHYDVHRAMQNKITTRSGSQRLRTCRFGYIALVLSAVAVRLL